MTIHVLSKETIEQIAAGEVIERPMSVVKELVENAIDAGATAISVEVKNGGAELIRVTDNGSGIRREDLPLAFTNHATSKIEDAKDLETVRTMGFRGEALPSIASVSELEVITKRPEDAVGTLHVRRGNEFVSEEEIGAPNGTTFLVKNLFFNTPARLKFLKTPMTEQSYVSDLMEKIALSHPDIRFKLTMNGQEKFATPGNGSLKDLIYTVFGRDTASEVVEVDAETGGILVRGYVGKPVLSKGSRSFEIYFVNGRYVKDRVVEKALEDACQPFMMQHRYPFAVLNIELPESDFDVNVHPRKMEIRFLKEGAVYNAVHTAVKNALFHREFVPEGKLTEETKKPEEAPKYRAPEPFEAKRQEETARQASGLRPLSGVPVTEPPKGEPSECIPQPETIEDGKTPYQTSAPEAPVSRPEEDVVSKAPEPKGTWTQQNFLSHIASDRFRLIGQIFDTYWILEMDDDMYIMDQHAAHEKVLFEEKMRDYRERKISSQLLSPAVTLTLSGREEEILNRHLDAFQRMGFEIEPFGARSYIVSAVPSNLFSLNSAELFQEILSDLSEDYGEKDPEMLLTRVATMSCKAAVKGNTRLSEEEAKALLRKLLTLDNPYACPHGRPTLVKITKQELEKKFKRIV